MAVLVNKQVITITPSDSPQVFQGTIPNNSTDFRAEAKRIPSATPFPPGENRVTEVAIDVSTNGGASWTNIGGGILQDAVENSLEPGGIVIAATIPRSPGRLLRTTVIRLSGTIKFTVFAEIV